MNNARYFELIDTVVNDHLAAAVGTDIRALSAIGVVAEVSCRYFAEMTYPGSLDLGISVERLGTSSIVYRWTSSRATPTATARSPQPRAASSTSTSTTPTPRAR